MPDFRGIGFTSVHETLILENWVQRK